MNFFFSKYRSVQCEPLNFWNLLEWAKLETVEVENFTTSGIRDCLVKPIDAPVTAMHSCFPPLATLSIRDRPLQNPTILTGHAPPAHRKSITSCEDEHRQNGGKIEILEDLDLYYIRQIPLKRKVTHKIWNTYKWDILITILEIMKINIYIRFCMM